MDPNSQAYQTGFWIGFLVSYLIVGLGLGALVGLIPLKMGESRGDETVGKIGFFACIAGSMISGILGAFSMAIGFAIAILVGRRRA